MTGMGRLVALLDRPLRPALGRTPREVLLILLGLGMLGTALYRGDRSWNPYGIAVATGLLATRFFAARIVWLCLVSAASWMWLWIGVDPAMRGTAAIALAQFAATLALLWSRDLRQRFDVGGREVGPLRNFLGGLRPADRALAIGVACAGTTSAAALHQAAFANVETFTWVSIALGGWLAAALLLLAGRALGMVLGLFAATLTAVKLAPGLVDAAHYLRGGAIGEWRPLLYRPEFTLAAASAAMLTALLATWWLRRMLATMR